MSTTVWVATSGTIRTVLLWACGVWFLGMAAALRVWPRWYMRRTWPGAPPSPSGSDPAPVPARVRAYCLRCVLVAGGVLAFSMSPLSDASCRHAGISGGAAAEGDCARHGRRLYVVNSGHAIRTPAYSVELLDSSAAPVRVETLPFDPDRFLAEMRDDRCRCLPDHWPQRSLYAAVQLRVTNHGAAPMPGFDPAGKAVHLLPAVQDGVNYGWREVQVDLPGYPALARRSDPIAPGQSAEGWLFFALPYSDSVIPRRPKADLFVDRGEPFYGEIRLWKHADEAGERAAGFRHLDVFGVD